MLALAKKELYNEVQKERRIQQSVVQEAINFLGELKIKDPTLFWAHMVGADGKLLHLFWANGCCQVDYEVFGDVLAFDATYGRNKYKCPVVVFSGVNHHKQTCVFACAIVSDENEETYLWVLQQFLQAMGGRSPSIVITDGDLAMRNAIIAVFPDAHHRLCGWHLIRNVMTNVGDIRFTKHFKTCMLGNFELHQFEERWRAAVEECDLTENVWVQQLYDKKLMWATAHIKGKFFAGMRTTSRCEALHSHMGKYVQSGFNLVEFLYHFQRCLKYMRSKEVEADFKSSYSVPVLQTEVESLDRYGASIYTREIFHIFRRRLKKSLTMNVVDQIETVTSNIFVVMKYGYRRWTWHVAFYPNDREVRCSCLAMESDGIPCAHIIRVLVLLDFEELPKTLVLDRWMKSAKASAERRHFNNTTVGDNDMINGRYSALIDSCRRLCMHASRNEEYYMDIRQKITYEIEQVENKEQPEWSSCGGDGHVLEPVAFRRQTRVGTDPGSGQRGRRVYKCSCCTGEGHTRKNYPHAARIGAMNNSIGASGASIPLHRYD